MADPSIWPNVVTAVATLAAGFGGVSLTLRHGNRRFELEQRDRWHAEQRQAVVELLHVGHEWTVAATAMLMCIAITADEKKIGDSSEQREYRAKREEFGRALVTARLVVTEPDPNGAVRACPRCARTCRKRSSRR